MAPQSFQNSEFDMEFKSHLHFGLETCPTCDQVIPPNKLEEISGKITARERERRLAITEELEKRHAIEKEQASAKAQAALASEREQSAARVTRAREEAQQAAEKLIGDRLIEADQERQNLVSAWEQRIKEEAAKRESVEREETSLRAKIEELIETNATALQEASVKAEQREIEIQNEAKQMAGLEAAERIASFEAAQRESVARLQAQVDEAEANRVAAEQKEVALTQQLNELQQASATEVAKVKEEAVAAEVRIRQVATEAAEVRFRDSIAMQEKAVAEANAKVLQVEQQALELQQTLNDQREILEKDKENAINAERAKAFNENQKLANTVNELNRALEKKSAYELGEGAEVDIFEALKTEFQEDRITRIPKGAAGADVRHIVMHGGKECGTILYDSKNHKQFRYDHVSKLRTDQLAEKAEHAVLSTHRFPQGCSQIHIHDGVVLANPARVISIAVILRQHLLHLHTLRISGIEREEKMATLYEFITSVQCSDLLGRIDERADDLLELQEKEIKWHGNNWRKQGEAIRAIQKAKGDLANRVSSIVGSLEDDASIDAS